MKCECGEELRWLYYAKNEVSPMERGAEYVEVDYAICSSCEKIYKCIIQSKVNWVLMVVQKEADEK